MKHLLLLLVLMCVACGAEFHGTVDDVGEAGAPVGSAGSSSAGTGNVATGGSAGSAGAPSAGAGGAPVTSCTDPVVTPPSTFVMPEWELESGNTCNTCSPETCLTCAIEWTELSRIDEHTYESTIVSFDCGGPVRFELGSCDTDVGSCSPEVVMPASFPSLRFVVQDGAVAQVLAKQGEWTENLGLLGVSDLDCSGSSPDNWTALLQSDLNAAFQAALRGATVVCP